MEEVPDLHLVPFSDQDLAIKFQNQFLKSSTSILSWTTTRPTRLPRLSSTRWFASSDSIRLIHLVTSVTYLFCSWFQSVIPEEKPLLSLKFKPWIKGLVLWTNHISLCEQDFHPGNNSQPGDSWSSPARSQIIGHHQPDHRSPVITSQITDLQSSPARSPITGHHQPDH